MPIYEAYFRLFDDNSAHHFNFGVEGQTDSFLTHAKNMCWFIQVCNLRTYYKNRVAFQS